MIFLGIESSCDETAVALIQGSRPLGHVIYSQDHRASGGVIPQVAAREHLHHLPLVIAHMLDQARISLTDIDGIGVSAGPGLVGGLLVGILWAKGLALALSKPLWPVHHLEAHALMVRMKTQVDFPYLLLLLSGGHCILAIVHGVGHYQVLGQTRDDAAGECLDKVARALGGPYPGGAYIEQQALKGNSYAIPLPVPLHHQGGLDFSFSGLKTACLRWITQHPDLPHSSSLRSDFCASFQRVIADSLCQRLSTALAQTRLSHCVISGGVASNQYFRTRLEATCRDHRSLFIAPNPADCTDNGLMIAWATHEYYQAGISPCDDFSARPRWPLENLSAL